MRTTWWGRAVALVAAGVLLAGCGTSAGDAILHTSACQRLNLVGMHANAVLAGAAPPDVALFAGTVVGELVGETPSREILASRYGDDLASVRDRVILGLQYAVANDTLPPDAADAVDDARALWEEWGCEDAVPSHGWTEAAPPRTTGLQGL
jgi:hypothetical protein